MQCALEVLSQLVLCSQNVTKSDLSVADEQLRAHLALRRHGFQPLRETTLQQRLGQVAARHLFNENNRVD